MASAPEPAIHRTISTQPSRQVHPASGQATDRAITADTALRLAKALGTTPDLWLNLQKRYDLDCARDAAKDLARIEPIRIRAGG